MLVGAHDRAVDHRVFVVGIGREVLEHALPHIRLGPAAEASMHRDAVTEALGQVAPWHTSAKTIKHGFDEQSVVERGHAHMALTPGKQVLYAVPLIVAKAVAPHRSAPYQLTSYESKFPPLRNPLNDDTP